MLTLKIKVNCMKAAISAAFILGILLLTVLAPGCQKERSPKVTEVIGALDEPWTNNQLHTNVSRNQLAKLARFESRTVGEEKGLQPQNLAKLIKYQSK
jgi:hypothetical protein